MQSNSLVEATFRVLRAEGIDKSTTADIFAGKKVALFAVPGAFTPTCHLKHLPGFLDKADAFKKKGVNTVACVAVNNPFVLEAWSKATGGKAKSCSCLTAMANSPKRSASISTAAASDLARAPNATRCWWMTAWSRCSTSKSRRRRRCEHRREASRQGVGRSRLALRRPRNVAVSKGEASAGGLPSVRACASARREGRESSVVWFPPHLFRRPSRCYGGARMPEARLQGHVSVFGCASGSETGPCPRAPAHRRARSRHGRAWPLTQCQRDVVPLGGLLEPLP